MKHSVTIKVRSYECDSYGHVNNATYLNYLEIARIDFLEYIGIDYVKMRESGYGLFVREINIRYINPARAGEELIITSYPIKKGAASGVFRQEITRRDGRPVADAEVGWVFVNDAGRPVKIPSDFEVAGFSPEK
jgi:acyl-CoA thioester hydrolase